MAVTSTISFAESVMSTPPNPTKSIDVGTLPTEDIEESVPIGHLAVVTVVPEAPPVAGEEMVDIGKIGVIPTLPTAPPMAGEETVDIGKMGVIPTSPTAPPVAGEEMVEIGKIGVIPTLPTAPPMAGEETVEIGKTMTTRPSTPAAQWERIKKTHPTTPYERVSAPIASVVTKRVSAPTITKAPTLAPPGPPKTATASELKTVFMLLSTCKSMDKLVTETKLDETIIRKCIDVLTDVGIVVADGTGNMCSYEAVQTLYDKLKVVKKRT